MTRVGIVQLRTRVAEVAAKHEIDLRIESDPIPPHRVMKGDKFITPSGTSTEVAGAFEQWVAGYEDGIADACAMF